MNISGRYFNNVTFSIQMIELSMCFRATLLIILQDDRTMVKRLTYKCIAISYSWKYLASCIYSKMNPNLLISKETHRFHLIIFFYDSKLFALKFYLSQDP